MGLPCHAGNGIYSPGKVQFQGAWREKKVNRMEHWWGGRVKRGMLFKGEFGLKAKSKTRRKGKVMRMTCLKDETMWKDSENWVHAGTLGEGIWNLEKCPVKAWISQVSFPPFSQKRTLSHQAQSWGGGSKVQAANTNTNSFFWTEELGRGVLVGQRVWSGGEQ